MFVFKRFHFFLSPQEICGRDLWSDREWNFAGNDKGTTHPAGLTLGVIEESKSATGITEKG
jgi:hypothetical protein